MSKTIVMIILFMLLITSTFIIIKLSLPKEQVITQEQINCNHEYITVSEYNWWFKSYKTFSRCIKCGKEIR